MHNYSIKAMVRDFNADPYRNPENIKFIDLIIADILFLISFGVAFHRENVGSAIDFCVTESNNRVVES